MKNKERSTNEILPTPLPKWLDARYGLLWKTFPGTEFRMEDAVSLLGKAQTDSRKEITAILSELRRAGWLNVKFDPRDARKRIYTLRSKEEMVEKIFESEQRKLGRSDIKTILKKAADLIRTRVDYKFILMLLFLKRISDLWELEFQKAKSEAKEDGLSEEGAEEEARNAAFHEFDIPEEALWENLSKETVALPEKLSRAFKTLADQNPEMNDVLQSVDFVSFTSNQENAEILRQLVELFSEKKLQHVSEDILGDAYEWILEYFAPQKAKEGEVYTPREIIDLLVRVLDPQPGESIYDPASASNGMLIRSYKHVKDGLSKKEADKLFLYGQEVNPKTLALGKMNLYIHGIRNHWLEGGDTLLFPKFQDGDDIKQDFDVVIANPPWNQDGYPEEVLKQGNFWKKRFTFGFVPKQSADWAWVQHMLASAKEGTGRVGVVIDNGCLFRGGKEKAVRTTVLEADLIECVILLPEKLFYNTGAPGAILILRKNKPDSRKGKVLFINASEEFSKHPDVRKLNILGEENLERIVKAFEAAEGGEGFVRLVDFEELKENDFNLNVTLYVFPEEEQEEIDLALEWQELKKVEQELSNVEGKLETYLKEIGVDEERKN